MPNGLINREIKDAKDKLSDEGNVGQKHYQDYTDRGIGDIEKHLGEQARDGITENQNQAGSQAQSSANATSSDPNNQLYNNMQGNGKNTPKFARAKSAAKKIAGVGLGIKVAVVALIAIAILAFAAFFGIGSLQAIHLAQVLALDHSTSIQYTDIRTHSMYRYVRSGGDLGETRMSWLGSSIFSKSVAELKGIGVTFDDNKTFGTLKGIVIDTSKFPETKGVPDADVPNKLSSYFSDEGLKSSDVTMRDGKAIVNKDLSMAARKAIVKDSIAKLDDGKIPYFIKTRQAMKFYNLPTMFHPWRAVDGKILENLETRADLVRANKESKTGIKYEPSTRAAAYEKMKSSSSGFRANLDAALLIVGGMCMAKEVGEAAVVYNRDAIVVPQALEASRAMSVGSQQQSGLDFTPEQLNVNNQLMTDPDGKSIWDSAPMQSKTNTTSSSAGGTAMPDPYAQAFDENTSASALADAGGKTGDVLCSRGGKATQLVVGAAIAGLAIPTTGGAGLAAYQVFKTAGSAAASTYAMIQIQKLVFDSTTDDPIPDTVSAPDRGSLLAYGSREFANINARAGGGVTLSEQESAMVDSNIAKISNEEFKAKPLFAQMFDAKDYRSITGRFSMAIGTPQQSIKKFASSSVNIGATLSNSFKNLLPSAQAATAYDYGFNRAGIPDRIKNNPEFADPFGSGDKAAVILQNEVDGTTDTDYIARADKCFGVTIDRDSDDRWAVVPQRDVNPQSSEYQDADCSQSNDINWDRIIVFVSDSTNLEANACYLGDDQACQNIGAAQEEDVCSIGGGQTYTSVKGMPSWVKMPVVNAKPGGPVKGNVSIVMANIKEKGAVAPSLRNMTASNPDFIGLNEVGDSSLNDFESAAPGYGASRYNQVDGGPGGGLRSLDNAILYRKDTWKLLDQGRIKTTEDDKAIFSGSPVIWDRWASWAVFENKEGEVVPVIVTHAMTNAAKFPRQHGNPQLSRIQQYSLGMDILIELTSTLSQFGPVVIAGDMNSHADQGEWNAKSRLAKVGYDGVNSDVIYIFNPRGTKIANQKYIPIPIGSDHNGRSIFASIDMNGVGPGPLQDAPASVTTSSADCPDASGDQAAVAGQVEMKDDYASECGKYGPSVNCGGQCVDFVKFRLKKYIDENKFPSLGNGGDVVNTLATQYGYKKDNTPAVNAVVSWPAGGVPGSGANAAYGHVAMVSKVNPNGSIVVEEYNATTPAETYGTRTISANVAKLLTYAHTEVDFK